MAKRKPMWWDFKLHDVPKPVRVAAFTKCAARNTVLKRHPKALIDKIENTHAPARITSVGKISEAQS